MKKLYLLPFTFYLLLAIGCRPAAEPVSVSNQPVSINEVPVTGKQMPPRKPIPDMRFVEFDGKTNADGAEKTLGDLRGKVVILDFWATYCPPCLDAIPHLNELQTKYEAEGLEVIGMHSDSDDRLKVPEFAERLKINYTLATPERDLTNFVFATNTAIPQMIVLDRQGNLVESFVGYDLKIKNDLDKAVEKALKQ